MNKNLFLVGLLMLISFNVVTAKSSDLFTDHLSSIIYHDCQGKDLLIKEPFIIDTTTNKTISRINWPLYDNGKLRQLIELFGTSEPWDFFQGTCDNRGVSIGGAKDACGILKCGNNTLDINQYTYFWNGERVDVPQETTNIAINNQGNLVQGLANNVQQNQSTTELNNCTISFGDLSNKIDLYSNIVGLIISILGSSLFYLIYYRKADKVRKNKAILISIICFILFLIITYTINGRLF
jgi:hypothetical protein